MLVFASESCYLTLLPWPDICFAPPAMANEQTPLLDPEGPTAHAHQKTALDAKHEALYQRFSPSKKRAIVALVSCSSLLPRTHFQHIESIVHFSDIIPVFAGGSFVPAIPQIAHDMNSNGQTIRYRTSKTML